MAAYFFDSSALVKCYVAETGSEWARSIVDDDDNIIHITSLTRVEIISALTRRFRRADITEAEFDKALIESQLDIPNRFEVVALSDFTIEEAAALARNHGVRAYDAVQLAAALDTSRIISQVESTELTLVSADVDLNAAAAAEGLNVKDPNTHEPLLKKTEES